MNNQKIVTKKDIVDYIYCLPNVELKKEDIKFVLDRIFDRIVAVVDSSDAVRISDFGTFKTYDKDESFGTNPRTGEQIIIPAHRIVKFVAAKKFKETVNN